MPPALALLAVSFSLGIALREGLGLSGGFAGVLTALASLALVRALLRRRGLGVASLAQALALGVLAAAVAWPRAPEGLLDGKPWDAVGRVEQVDDAFGQARLVVGLEAVARDGAARAASGRVQVTLGGEPLEALIPGDRVRFRARFVAPHGFVEPDAPDPLRRLAERGVMATAGVGEPAALARLASTEERVDDGPRAAWAVRVAARAEAVRGVLLAHLARHLDGERRALVASLVLGDRSGISRELDDAFRAAGVSHVLSVSGLHLAIAAFLSFVGLRRLLAWIAPLARRVPVRRVAAALSIASVIGYTLLTGGAVATVRSCVAAVIYFAGAALGRPATAATAIAGAALAILVVSPLALYDPSFQLSFAATLGCALLAPPLLARVRGLCQYDGNLAKRLAGRLARAALGLVIVSAAATAATAPLTAWHFAQVAPAGLLANVVVVPLAELFVLPLGLGACALAPLSDALAGLPFHVAGIGAAAMAWAVRWFASWAPAGRVPAPTMVEAVLWYAALAAWVIAGRLDGNAARRARRAALVVALTLGAVLATRGLTARLFPVLTVTFLDVGQGDSCLVEFPGGPTLLVDGGGSFDNDFDPGERVLVPWLERHGVRRVDVVVLTHPHPDHANGLAAVVDHFPVGEVWTNGAVSSLPGLVRLEQAAARRGAKVVRPHRLDVSPGAVVDVLHPLADGAPVDGVVRVPAGLSENDGSIVLRLRYAGRVVLLTGDVERRAEARLVEHAQSPHAATDDASLRADVIKVPHHCSRTSSTAPFVASVAPRVAVCSVGRDNRWGFPAAEVVDRWRGAGARVLRIDRDGAVTVRIASNGSLSVETARAAP